MNPLAPYPFATIRSGDTPLRARYARTEAARACASRTVSGAHAALSVEPAGVLGHLSRSSGTPSPSESRISCRGSGQPAVSTGVPAGVLGHLSRPSGTPSKSESIGQPFASTSAPAGVLGH